MMEHGEGARAFDAVRVDGLCKLFGRRAALSSVDAELEAGQISLVMGPNGAGKSTLLNILSTLGRPSEGEVRYGRLDHQEARKRLRRWIGIVAHATMLYPDLTVRENLSFFGSLYELPGLAAALDEQLERLGLAEASGRAVRELSRGMQQRATLARALLVRPQLLLLDEAFSGLDRQGGTMLREIVEGARAEGRIVVLVAHDVEPLDGLCDQLIVLEGGRVAATVREQRLASERLLEAYQEAVRGGSE